MGTSTGLEHQVQSLVQQWGPGALPRVDLPYVIRDGGSRCRSMEARGSVVALGNCGALRQVHRGRRVAGVKGE